MNRSGHPLSDRGRNFFQLRAPYASLREPEQFFELVKDPSPIVENVIFWPDELHGSTSKFPRAIKGKTFRNVSFTRTHITSISFYDCTFEECLFIGSQIEKCEFHNCKFIDTNTHKIDFLNVYIDPKSFENCLRPHVDQNIGTHLYQRLMNNSNDENQRSFGRSASFQFNAWKRRQWFYEFRRDFSSNPAKSINAFLFGVGRWFWGLWGAGVHLGRFMLSFACMLLTLSIFNFLLRDNLGLAKVSEFTDAVYFTVITLTTIGYGDITPSKIEGKMVMAAEGFIGFFLFALAASIVFRRIAP